MSEATATEKYIVFGLVGAYALYVAYLGELREAKDLIMVLVVYATSRDGV